MRSIIVLGASIAVCRAAYDLAISRARQWGEVVKSAFDLYLPDLAKQMGYELPKTRQARADFWSAFNLQALVHQSISPE